MSGWKVVVACFSGFFGWDFFYPVVVVVVVVAAAIGIICFVMLCF